ncbi:hypothetical protein [Candidatus Hakubella thermalkaliphila]|uniref:hypothetical protein n=1 Tax=Candidatus Hakubella thermalkaliphila TaxID=2754717 RepID=UPI00159348CD|nr:hypothetical protein [Candidatus Hakubella thermalkaliphila]
MKITQFSCDVVRRGAWRFLRYIYLENRFPFPSFVGDGPIMENYLEIVDLYLHIAFDSVNCLILQGYVKIIFC